MKSGRRLLARLGLLLALWPAAAVGAPLIAEGTLGEHSPVPRPSRTESDYPDANFTAELRLAPAPGRPERRILLLLPAFRRFDAAPEAALRPGDRLRAELIPYEELPAAEREIQVSDAFALSELPLFGVRTVRRIDGFDPALPPPVLPGTAEAAETAWSNPPLPAAAAARLRAIAADRKRLARMLPDPAGRRELADRFERAAARLRLTRLRNGDGYFQRDGMSFVLPRRFRLYGPWRDEAVREPDRARPVSTANVAKTMRCGAHDDAAWRRRSLPALIALNRFLAARQVQLLVVIVPDLYAVAARRLLPDFAGRADEGTGMVAAGLLEAGIEAVWFDPELLAAASGAEPLFAYWRGDGHPLRRTQQLAARLTAERLRRFALPRQVAAERFGTAEAGREQPFAGEAAELPPEWTVRRVTLDGRALDCAAVAESPWLVAGNSFAGGFAEELASATGIVPSAALHAGAGVGTALIRRLRETPRKLLAGRRALILVLGYPHFFYRNWSVIDAPAEK